MPPHILSHLSGNVPKDKPTIRPQCLGPHWIEKRSNSGLGSSILLCQQAYFATVAKIAAVTVDSLHRDHIGALALHRERIASPSCFLPQGQGSCGAVTAPPPPPVPLSRGQSPACVTVSSVARVWRVNDRIYQSLLHRIAPQGTWSSAGDDRSTLGVGRRRPCRRRRWAPPVSSFTCGAWSALCRRHTIHCTRVGYRAQVIVLHCPQPP